ncbi:hypothetical protein SPBR_04691 [Sporothrix brasiliensis 5110]|uniref:Mid2 domain-containing protein n=1 Tax=Sporothrix brasiliensis 5110 TaxID=1398154 RepID=A0A0C2IL94_9PEZI|nr:uncharacterized protein SPBR_04691 [Sporothrix brasiliensis 5110]KIH87750.1 hypothetical protein SPBR_04691 [Sporothrix brasiliensis 5110]
MRLSTPALLLAGWLAPVVSAGVALQAADSNALVTRSSAKNSTAIHKSFKGATLFAGKYPVSDVLIGVAATCVDCYLTAQLHTELIVIQANHSAAPQNLSSVAHEFVHDIVNITETFFDDIFQYVKNSTKTVVHEIVHHEPIEDIFHNFTRPDIDFDLKDLAPLPEYQFLLTLDKIDLFVQLDLVVSAATSYTVNLFTSESDFGVRKGDDLELGVVLTVDLILSASGVVDLEGGFHLRMDEGLSLQVDLFGHNVSEIVCHGGKFEFLPVTLRSAGVTLNALLRVGVHAGIIVSSDALQVPGFDDAKYSAGIETIVYADVANLTLIVAAGPGITDGGSAKGHGTTPPTKALAAVEAGAGAVAEVAKASSDEAACANSDVIIEGIFNFDIGAKAGASLVIGDFLSWGVNPATMLPVFYTTVTQCVAFSSHVAPATSTATATPAAVGVGAATTSKVAARAVSTTAAVNTATSVTTVISTTFVHTAVACLSPGLVSCPNSLQTTAVTTATSTTTLTVDAASAEDVTFPEPTNTAPITRVAAFGNNAQPMALTVSGTPVSFVPPPPKTSSGAPSSSSTSGSDPTSTGVTIAGVHVSSKTEHIIIGAAVGAGVPLLIGGIALIFCANFGHQRLVWKRLGLGGHDTRRVQHPQQVRQLAVQRRTVDQVAQRGQHALQGASRCLFLADRLDNGRGEFDLVVDSQAW